MPLARRALSSPPPRGGGAAGPRAGWGGCSLRGAAMPFDQELAAALDAAARASDLIRREYESFKAIPDAPASISTHVDKASQDLILKLLHTQFPGDALCAEES